MSCTKCVNDLNRTTTDLGIAPDEALAAWATATVGQVWEYLPRCPHCKHWVSPRTGICRYRHCPANGEQVAPVYTWPPAGVTLLRSKARVQEIRAATGEAPPAPPPVFAPAGAEPAVEETAAGTEEEAAAGTEEELAPVAPYAGTPRPRNENDYTITDADAIGEGGAKTKYRQNVAAIKLLKQLEAEEREATDEEKAVLVKFCGWGGLAQAFDRSNDYYDPRWHSKKPEWYDEYKELQGLLTPEEYSSARGSTPNAHYTSPEVIRAMWDGLKQLGFEEGTVLEPAAGVGHFLGCCPEDLTRNTSRVAVELDSLTGRIAARLYPDSNVQVCGFQEAKLADDFFDVAVSNVPFGNYPVYDPEFKKGRGYLSKSIHNYFFAKALDKVRPGGVVAFVTSHFTLDGEDPRVREYLASQADLVGAVRLPNTAFKGNAMTEVTTDIIFLRKREPGEAPGDTSWVQAEKMSVPGKDGKQEQRAVNRYFHDHPEMLMGRLESTGTMYGRGELTLANDGRDMGQALREAMGRLPQGVMKPRTRCPSCKAFMAPGGPCNNPNCPTKRAVFKASPVAPVKEGSLAVADGKVYRRQRGRLQEVAEVKPKDVPRIEGLAAVRDAAREVLNCNVEAADDDTLAAAQAKLNAAYDAFVAQYGPLSARANKRAFGEDPDFPFLLALENDYNPDTNTANKASIFTQRTIQPVERATHADTAKDALLISLNESGVIDWARMAELTGRSEEYLQRQLAGQVFKDPAGDWVTRDEYLSGRVVDKLAEAEAAAAVNPSYQANVEALRTVQPRELTPDEINASLGSGWIPAEDVAAFAQSLFDQELRISYIEGLAKWLVEPGGRWFWKGPAFTSTWGTRRVDGMELLDQALNGKVPTVYDTFRDSEGGEVRSINQSETLAAREIQDKMKARFKQWVWENPDRASRLSAAYNRTFNTFVPRRYDGSHLTLPGTGADMPPLRPHQKNAIWRVVQSGGNNLLAHIVGAGKTFSMIGAGMELRRLGMRRKVMHVVPNHLLDQYGADFVKMYPGAKVLLVPAKDLGNADKRRETMSRIATDDWDAVVVTHSAFEKLPVKDETFDSFVQQEIDTLDEFLSEIKSSKGGGRDDRRTVKEIEKAKKRLEAKLQARRDKGRKDDTITWEECGVDQVFVDEAQAYKNLYFPTQRQRVAGIGQSESNRAFDMFIKTQHLTRHCEKCGKFVGADGVCTNCRAGTEIARGGVCFATGTPISNSVCEMYTMMRYLQFDRLQELGLEHFDAWANQFGDTVTALEMKPAGDGYREYTRFAKFNNVPELMRTFMEVADIEQDPDKLGLARPKLASGQAIGVSAPASAELKAFIQECARRAENLPKDPREDNMLKIVNDANKAALDMRLVNPSLPDDPNSKVNRAVANIVDVYRKTTGMAVAGHEGTHDMAQMVFLDTSVPTKDGSFNVYDDIKQKLVAAGIPAGQIAYIHDADSDAKKLELFDKVNAGQVRVLMGSTEKMGSGTNAQRRLAALHHIDAPWRPSDVEQREGRILRQGNINPEVKVYRYATEESFDVYKWQVLQTKAKFIGQVMRGDLETRSIEDLDQIVIGYAEMKALATGNPVIIERIKTEGELRKMGALRKAHQNRTYQLGRSIQLAQDNINGARRWIANYEKAQEHLAGQARNGVVINGRRYGEKEREEAGKAFMDTVDRYANTQVSEIVGEIAGCQIRVAGQGHEKPPRVVVSVTPEINIDVDPSTSAGGNVTKLWNAVDSLPKRIEAERGRIARFETQIAQETVEMAKPFEHAETVTRLEQRLVELDAEVAALSGDKGKQVAGE